FIILPIIMYMSSSVRNKLGGVLTASILVVVGVIFNRMNVVFTGMAGAMGGSYFPSIWEWLITIDMWSGLVLFYCFAVENFPILAKEEHTHGTGHSVGSGFHA
ncbi:MAG: hydrogenase, partial [Desulfotomaculaceae bacterium]